MYSFNDIASRDMFVIRYFSKTFSKPGGISFSSPTGPPHGTHWSIQGVKRLNKNVGIS